MRLFSGGEIVKKGKKGSTRQILDLAEKGIIHPARETTGSGSARLYDTQNFFDILVCLSIRGMLPPDGLSQEFLKKVLRCLSDHTPFDLQSAGKDESHVDYVILEVADPSNYIIRGFRKDKMDDLENGWEFMEESRTPSSHPTPMPFGFILLNVAAIKAHLVKVLS